MRKSCILMHISSLPSDYGIGKMGKAAYDFVDFLEESGTMCWQILPISPTSYGDSPYSSFSVYAGNPYFVDFDILKQEGLLKKSDYEHIKWQETPELVDYNKIYANCFKVLKTAFRNSKNQSDGKFAKFKADNSFWLDDYALFMAVKFKNAGKAWYEWDKKIAFRNETALKKISSQLKDDIEFFKFVQYKFFEQWGNLKHYANEKGIKIIGDVPIYVAYDSADVWANPQLFCLDEERKPIDVAGCPPDDFAPTGQLWGNPLYDWKKHKETGYDWWTKRMKAASSVYDIVRIDHFRGFESYYAIPYGEPTAENGEWRKGAGIDLFKTLSKKLGKLDIIAEDLGFITPDVRKLLSDSGFPGMKVLQFGFYSPSSEHLPHNFTTSNCTAYTGTHDNETILGWVDTLSKKELKFCKNYLGVSKRRQIPWAMIRSAWASCADLAVAQMQDFLELGSDARMNTPSTLGNNWQYRAKAEDFTPKLAKKIYKLNYLYNRNLEVYLKEKAASVSEKTVSEMVTTKSAPKKKSVNS